MPRNTRNYPLFLPLYIIYNNVYTPESPLWMGCESIICDDLIKKVWLFLCGLCKKQYLCTRKTETETFLESKMRP